MEEHQDRDDDGHDGPHHGPDEPPPVRVHVLHVLAQGGQPREFLGPHEEPIPEGPVRFDRLGGRQVDLVFPRDLPRDDAAQVLAPASSPIPASSAITKYLLLKATQRKGPFSTCVPSTRFRDSDRIPACKSVQDECGGPLFVSVPLLVERDPRAQIGEEELRIHAGNPTWTSTT